MGPVLKGSPDDQPFWGLSQKMKPVYQATIDEKDSKCFNIPDQSKIPAFCIWAHRNLPYFDWNPAIVVFPLKVEHVQAAVNFAVKHNLCVAVASTGNDLLNRHSCSDGIFIRLNLMKNIDWALTDARGFGHTPGTVISDPE